MCKREREREQAREWKSKRETKRVNGMRNEILRVQIISPLSYSNDVGGNSVKEGPCDERNNQGSISEFDNGMNMDNQLWTTWKYYVNIKCSEEKRF